MSSPTVDFSDAEWWWPEGVEPHKNQYADFVGDFVFPGIPKVAWVALTCGSWYTLWVGDECVSHGPPREVAPWQYYDVVDLDGILTKGMNRLRIRVHHLGVTTQFHEPCLAGLLLRGVAEGDGWRSDLGERFAWRAALSPGFLVDAPRLHPCIGFGEHVILADTPSDSLLRNQDWKAPACVAKHPLLDRGNLLPSDLPRFTGKKWTASYRGAHEGWQIWDFGGEVFGFLNLEVEAGEAGTCTLLHGESLAGDGLPDFGFSGGDFRDILELPEGRRCWESFEKRALRYLAMPARFCVRGLSVRESHRPLVEIWRALPAVEKLSAIDRAIIEAAARTVTLCCDDLLNDCPRRERSQYNDPSIYMKAFPQLFGTWEPIRRWLRQYIRGAGPDGVLRMCYPSPTGQEIIPDFSISFAGNLRQYFENTADIETVRACFDSAVAGVAAFEQFTDTDGLLVDVPGWIFLCNSFELAKFPRSAALNGLWAGAWKHLGEIASQLADDRSLEFLSKADNLRAAWRRCFLRDGRILDADSSIDHERRQWWNYHYEADRGWFDDGMDFAFVLKVCWEGPARRLAVAAAGKVRVICDSTVLLDAEALQPWHRPYPFHPWEFDLPEGFSGGELVFEVWANRIDWEVYVAADSGSPTAAWVVDPPSRREAHDLVPPAKRPVKLRRWGAPRHNQITVGYAVESGMLEGFEAKPLLRACIRDHYHVPWMKRTTPLICTKTDDAGLIADRVVLCNTPQSLEYFCRALDQHGMRDEARELCRRLFGVMIESGSSTLWEEFAPRSSLCHAWGAMCVPYLLGEQNPARARLV